VGEAVAWMSGWVLRSVLTRVLVCVLLPLPPAGLLRRRRVVRGGGTRLAILIIIRTRRSSLFGRGRGPVMTHCEGIGERKA
jgi:hypothetical protein